MARKDWITTEEWAAAEHPSSRDRRELPKVRREWTGRRVALHYVKSRGHAYRRTSMGWKFGVLVKAERDEHISVKDNKGTVHNVHYTRVVGVYDLSRRLCAAKHIHAEHGYALGNCTKPLGHTGDHLDSRGTWTDADTERGLAAQARMAADRQARRDAEHAEYLARRAEQGGDR